MNVSRRIHTRFLPQSKQATTKRNRPFGQDILLTKENRNPTRDKTPNSVRWRERRPFRPPDKQSGKDRTTWRTSEIEIYKAGHCDATGMSRKIRTQRVFCNFLCISIVQSISVVSRQNSKVLSLVWHNRPLTWQFVYQKSGRFAVIVKRSITAKTDPPTVKLEIRFLIIGVRLCYYTASPPRTGGERIKPSHFRIAKQFWRAWEDQPPSKKSLAG